MSVSKATTKKLISIVIPCYNEAINVASFYKQLQSVAINDKTHDYEFIYVDDGSKDNTLNELRVLSDRHSSVKVLSLSRNFGKEIATTAGIFYAKGDATIMIDGDGQHPVELIPQLIKLWEDGHMVVVGVRKTNKKEGFIKHYGSKLFYKLFNSTSDTTLIPGATDFRLIDKVVRQEFMHFTERYRITRGLIDWMGFKRAYVEFDANERMGGKSSYKVSKLIKLALNSFVSLSMAPLYFIGYAGLTITFVSLMAGVFVFVEQLLLADPLNLNVTGTAMLSILTLFLVGIIMTAQGLVSIYLSHIHIQTQNRPLFIVDPSNSINIDK